MPHITSHAEAWRFKICVVPMLFVKWPCVFQIMSFHRARLKHTNRQVSIVHIFIVFSLWNLECFLSLNPVFLSSHQYFIFIRPTAGQCRLFIQPTKWSQLIARPSRGLPWCVGLQHSSWRCAAFLLGQIPRLFRTWTCILWTPPEWGLRFKAVWVFLRQTLPSTSARCYREILATN